MGLRTRVSGGVYNSVALTIFWASLHAQIGLASSAGTPAASKVESLDALYQKGKTGRSCGCVRGHIDKNRGSRVSRFREALSGN